MALTIPAIVLRFSDASLANAVEALLFGLAIVGAAFILSWAAEVAQLDISAGLAIAVLAFIAVLPEYAVDMVLAWKGGNAFEQFGEAVQGAANDDAESACSLALANMTGANRLLIGIGWSMVVFIAAYRSRKSPPVLHEVRLDRPHSVEVAFLGLATVYSLTLPLKSQITLFDSVILVSIFVAYTWRISKAPAEVPHLRRLPLAGSGRSGSPDGGPSVIAMFVFAAVVILLSAEHFAEALVATGEQFNINEFLLIQWLAPLASEAPELLIAGLYAWRLNTNAGSRHARVLEGEPMDAAGRHPADRVRDRGRRPARPPGRRPPARGAVPHGGAVVLRAWPYLVTLSISVREAVVAVRAVLGAVHRRRDRPRVVHGDRARPRGSVYVVLGLVIFTRQRGLIRPLLRDGFKTSYRDLNRREIVGE